MRLFLRDKHFENYMQRAGLPSGFVIFNQRSLIENHLTDVEERVKKLHPEKTVIRRGYSEQAKAYVLVVTDSPSPVDCIFDRMERRRANPQPMMITDMKYA